MRAGPFRQSTGDARFQGSVQDSLMDKTGGNRPCLLVTTSDAARALAISSWKLWVLTKAGEMLCVPVGRAVRYDVADLQKWIDTRKEVCP